MVHGITEYQIRKMKNGNIPFRSIVILLFTVLLSSCLKETAVPIESAFSIESSEDKTSPVTIQLKMRVMGLMSMNGYLRVELPIVPMRELRLRSCLHRQVSTK